MLIRLIDFLIEKIRNLLQKVALKNLLFKSNNWIQINPAKKYKQITVKIWGKGVILRNEVLGSEIASSKRLQVKSGQFIVSRIDARHGAFGLIPDFLNEAVVTNDFPVFDINTDKIRPKFLEYLSKTPDFIEICKQSSEGTTNRVRLKETKFLETIISPPSLEQQLWFENLITEIEILKKMKEKALEELDALLPSILYKAFKGEL